MNIVPLTKDYALTAFDCGDSDLNEFLLEDAKLFLEKRIANTYILEDEGKIAAYFCLLNDKVSRQEITNSRWNEIKDSFPDNKRFRSYPTIKIGRFAVAREYHGQHIGSTLMDTLKLFLKNDVSRSAFRYITVDAYLSAIPFYSKNGFAELTQKEESEHTRLMYFDMLEIE
ncbi:MAG: GNAT family N-acetyltransferase [Paludibacteraceae bacterium]|nr:GNAT family N-acetyltransferase [Paludibacteraceae bacterium]